MNLDILCICYSRTGKTKEAMERVAREMDAELVFLTDHVKRGGLLGFIRCGMDAMRKRTNMPILEETKRHLHRYKLVILGTPVWAGRCASVMRAFLKRRGAELENVAYVITHKSEETYTDVFRQMDRYTPKEHIAEASLCPDTVGYEFWLDQFFKNCTAFLQSETEQ